MSKTHLFGGPFRGVMNGGSGVGVRSLRVDFAHFLLEARLVEHAVIKNYPVGEKKNIGVGYSQKVIPKSSKPLNACLAK